MDEDGRHIYHVPNVKHFFTLSDRSINKITSCGWTIGVFPPVEGKAIQLQALTGPEGSRRLRIPDFKTIGTCRRQGCQPYAPAAFPLQEIFLVSYSFLLWAGWLSLYSDWLQA
jgi:hypothetical protein